VTISHKAPLRRLATGVATLVAASLLLVATPAVASADELDHGSTATCKARIVDELSDGTLIGHLRRIVVTPPTTMFSMFTFNPQPVSWRFVVEKAYRYWEGNPWKVIYKSPLQNRMASFTQPADFRTQSFLVPVPDPQESTTYRVEVRMMWWSFDQQLVLKRVRYLLPYMREVVDGQPTGAGVMPCYYSRPYYL